MDDQVEVTITANDFGMAYVLDRWTGRIEALHGKQRLDVEREAAIKR